MMMMMMTMMPTRVIRVKSEKCAQMPPLTPTRSKLTNWEPAEAGNQKRALLIELVTFVIIIIRKFKSIPEKSIAIKITYFIRKITQVQKQEERWGSAGKVQVLSYEV